MTAEVDVTAGGRISFDPQTQRYTLDGSTPLDRVTGVLVDHDIINGKWLTTAARIRGSDVHSAVHYLNEDDLDWSTVRPEILPFVRSYERLVKHSGLKVIRCETRTYDLAHFYVGTIDLVADIGGSEVIIDYKTIGRVTYRPPKWAALQTAAYEASYRKLYGGHVRRRAACVLMPDGSMPKIIYYDDTGDINKFLDLASSTRTRREYNCGKREPAED